MPDNGKRSRARHAQESQSRRLGAGGLRAPLLLALLFAGPFAAFGSQADAASAFLEPRQASQAPSGFRGLCGRYAWVCDGAHSAAFAHAGDLEIARRVNTGVNRSVRQVDDRVQYGRDEHWALPTARGGDCEDLVLLKKKMLIERGIPARALLIATVLDRRLTSHAVLVLRTAGGDFVLDSLTDRILPWNRTGYTFLKLQNPDAMATWNAVLAGGLAKDLPTASRQDRQP